MGQGAARPVSLCIPKPKPKPKPKPNPSPNPGPNPSPAPTPNLGPFLCYLEVAGAADDNPSWLEEDLASRVG